ncbi:short-chain dehydrogenase (plasmid) [Alloyangia pacifica]|uniref:Short-chain dehydrogenase n=1 Tax=Alloyangia pacifica TaxID=311180 RepID=A0A2U8HL78_9RHOB|nr:SDR family oxidoreductase [Alloyangia pacifica]AWI86709.1 short-chain dehydrogenase [Alloyangia pacifica]
MLLQGRTAIVTGAGNPDGIGFAVARKLVSEGAQVILADRDHNRLSGAAESLGASAIAKPCDVTSEDDCAALGALAHDRFGGLDILVNSAGITQSRRTRDITSADYDAVMNVNLRGTLLMCQTALGLMTSGASIICIASISAQRGGGLMGGPHYAASKAGVLGLIRAMARDVSPQGIRVNAINPGVIMSSMTRDFYDDELTAKVMPQILLGRFGETDDVANSALFLASGLSSYITGSCIDVNGGMHMN